MSAIIIWLIIISLPLLLCVYYVRNVLCEDVLYYFEGVQPKIAITIFVLFMLSFHFLPNVILSQVAAEASRHSSRLFSIIPGIATSMIIFPGVYGEVTGMDKKGVSRIAYTKFYRGVGWFFLFLVVVLALVL